MSLHSFALWVVRAVVQAAVVFTFATQFAVAGGLDGSR
jgi:hypothetical protein